MHLSADGGIVTIEPRVRLARNPVVYCHGAGSTSSDLTILANPEQPMRRIVKYGYSVIAKTLDVEDYWGTPEGVKVTKDLIATHRTKLGGAGPAVLYGGSMGTATALQTALTMLDQIACIVLVIPCFDLEHQRRANKVLQAYINEAWDKTPIETNLDPLPKGANPIDRAAELTSIPILMHVASDDDISYGYQTFARRHGNAQIVDLGPRGHSAEALAQIDPDAVAAFIQRHTDPSQA